MELMVQELVQIRQLLAANRLITVKQQFVPMIMVKSPQSVISVIKIIMAMEMNGPHIVTLEIKLLAVIIIKMKKID